MTTLREFILNQSTLPTGSSVRDHILNPSSGGSGLTLYDGLLVDLTDLFDIEVDPMLIRVLVDQPKYSI